MSIAPPDDRLSIRRELIGGVTTFLTMAYIVVVNPAILSTEGTGMPFNGVMTATVLVCFTMTMLMGLYAKLPFAVAPGMGINAFFTYSIILNNKVPWPTALGIIFWAGVFFMAISVTPVREAIAKAIPEVLRRAAAAGIGLFLTFIGLKNAGFVVAHPVTLVTRGPLTIETLLFFVGFLVTLWLMRRKSPLAFLAGIALVSAAAWSIGLVKPPQALFSTPDFTSVMLKLDIWGALQLSMMPAIIAILFTDLFDSIATLVGVSQATDLLDADGNPRNLKQGLIVDAMATLTAGLFGTSSGTAYIESAAGIEAGGRTGLTSVFTALCFLPCLFLAPLAGAVPPVATAPVLVIVGALMFRSILAMDLLHLEDLVPVYLIVILIPLTFSITQGILWGFIIYVAMHVLAGKGRGIAPTMYAITLACVGLLVVDYMAGQ